jgi:hypothetical protein
MNVLNKYARHIMWAGILTMALVAIGSIFSSPMGWAGLAFTGLGWYCQKDTPPSEKEGGD